MNEEQTMEEAIGSVASALRGIGTGNDPFPGAIEMVAMTLKEEIPLIAGGLSEIAEAGQAIAEALEELAKAVREKNKG
jgi:hypothetical protein